MATYQNGSFLDPLSVSNPWMAGNNNVNGMTMPHLFGTEQAGLQGTGSGGGGSQLGFTPDYVQGGNNGVGGSSPSNMFAPTNVPQSISLGTNYDSVLANSARSQSYTNAKWNEDMKKSYDNAMMVFNAGQGPKPEDYTPYLWETDFNKILSYGQQGLPGNGLDQKYAAGPSYFTTAVPAGAYNAINPSVAANTPGWDGLGVTSTAPPVGSVGGQPAPTPQFSQFSGMQPGFLDFLRSMQSFQQQSSIPVQNMLHPGGAGSSTSTTSTQPYNAGDVDFWRQLAQNPKPFDATDAWQKLILAQDERTKQNAGNLQEYMNVTGNRYSTAFGDSMGDFWEQTTRDQNSLLSQLQMQGYEAERNRQFGAASGVAQLTSQLGENEQQRTWQALQNALQRGWQSGENTAQRGWQGGENMYDRNFQWDTQGRQLDFNQWLTNANQGFQAAMYNAGATDQSGMALLNNSSQAANQLNQNAIYGASNLFGAENSALNNLFGAGVNSLPMWQQQQQFMQQMGLGTASSLGSLINSIQGIGGQLGGQQYATYNDQLSRAYQEWMRQQPWYHPNMQYLFPASFQQQNQYFPQYQPSMLSQTSGLLGSILPLLMTGMSGAQPGFQGNVQVPSWVYGVGNMPGGN